MFELIKIYVLLLMGVLGMFLSTHNQLHMDTETIFGKFLYVFNLIMILILGFAILLGVAMFVKNALLIM